MHWLYIYLAIINLLAFLLFASDKRKAVKKKRRIREATLLFVSFIGGSLGGLLAMMIFRHKTKKLVFRLSMPLMLVLHILLICLLIFKLKE